MYSCLKSVVVYVVALLVVEAYRKNDDETKCPHAKGTRNFDVSSIIGYWYVVQYATSEGNAVYKCMRSVFYMPSDRMDLSMNFTYHFVDDPDDVVLYGNINWTVPDSSQPSHWIHTEDSFEGIYNSYVLDSDNKEWLVLFHCAEKQKSPRYFTSMILSRNKTLPQSVINFLRNKLPRYDIDLDYMFDMTQRKCKDPMKNLHYASKNVLSKMAKRPLRRKERLVKTKMAKQRQKSN